MRLAVLALSFCLAAPGRAELLDLSTLSSCDWAREEHGAEAGAHALFASSSDPKEIAEQLKKLFGIRLSSEDREHVFAFSPGRLKSGGSVQLTQVNLDRIMHTLEAEVIVRSSAVADTKKDDGAEWRIGPAIDPVPEPARPEMKADKEGVNPLLVLKLGKLEPGQWWLRVRVYQEERGRRTEAAPIASSYVVKDNRMVQKNDKPKGYNTPEIGLQKPNSKGYSLGGP